MDRAMLRLQTAKAPRPRPSGDTHGRVRAITAIHAPMPAASRNLGIAVMDGLVQGHWLGDALELEGTDFDETESFRRDAR
jgi:hypothetical protein